jgi:hypothetical protein
VFKTVLLTAMTSFVSVTGIHSQEFSKGSSIALFTGLMNYQGDLKPNSFTFQHSNFSIALTVRQPVSRWFTVRTGFTMGKLEAADRYNRDYLKNRNLSFFSSLHEVHAGLELTLLDISTKRFTPYLYGGLAVFWFNPWTFDNTGKKIFLKPLGTEGQGLSEYPRQRPYSLTQLAIPFGAGVRIAVSEWVNVGIEFSQRKSFTDYIDDVSTHYVNREALLLARGSKAVEMAYRTDELRGSQDYPIHGEQRGTPSEMDWYYFFGTTVEIKLKRIVRYFQSRDPFKRSYQQRCPRVQL